MATVLKRCGLVVAVLLALPYVWSPVYRFPDPKIFTGSRIYNPYEGGRGSWQRANLHAHGRAWNGLTSGEQPDEEVVRRYRSLGYSVAGISDYERIAAHHGVETLPIYEHGYNVGKVHQLAIGARRVEWFDFLLWQSTSHEQYVIDRVGRSADLVALAHPSLRGAYSSDDLQKLAGYQLVEVVNGPFVVAEVWDAALSSGHAVWALANDDSHDMDDSRRIAAAWNMIDAPSPNTSDVVDALRAGRTYAVARTADAPGSTDTTLSGLTVRDGRMTVTCAGAPSTFVFIGQDGETRRRVEGVTAAEYLLTPADTYIRTVIQSPQATMYVNPVLRYDGDRLSTASSTVDATSTWLLRLSTALAGVLVVKLWRRRRETTSAPIGQPALQDPDRNPA